jgi:diguanylate cyclase (GGDEF)-like protein
MVTTNESWIEQMPIGFAQLVMETKEDQKRHFRFIKVNSLFELIVGLDRSLILGKTFSEILIDSLDSDCGLHGFCEGVCSEGTPQIYEQEVRCNGRDFQVSAIAGNPGELIVLLHDITELIRLRREMNDSQEELEHLNDRLYHESITDEMTGLFNRKHIMELLKKETARAERGLEFLTIALLDIDYFKSVNDEHGHQFGDFVLKAFSDALMEQVRTMDYVGRYGGEEFLLLFPGTKIGDVVEILDRIESMLRVNEFRQGDLAVTLQFSAGVVEYHGESIDYLIRRVDDLLHQAKAKGKSRVMLD